MVFTTEALHEIVRRLKQELGRVERAGGVLEFTVLDPDLGQGLFAGERLELAGQSYRYRSYKTWLDLAERLGCRLLTPRQEGPGRVRLRFAPLGAEASWQRQSAEPEAGEKYGASSAFSKLSKLEEPNFLLDLGDALGRVGLEPGSSVLDLGINTGDEFALFAVVYGDTWRTMRFTGVDHAASAIAQARTRFPGESFAFHCADINGLDGLGLGTFDLVLSVGTLQSPGVQGREVFRRIVQNHLKPAGSLILGFPNCRYRDGEIVYGARMKNFAQPDLSLLVKDLAFYKKYLQQHKFRVFITGKYYLFLTAVLTAARTKGAPRDRGTPNASGERSG